MNLKYMEVSLFEISYKKKMFHHIQFFLDVPVFIIKVKTLPRPPKRLIPTHPTCLHHNVEIFA